MLTGQERQPKQLPGFVNYTINSPIAFLAAMISKTKTRTTSYLNTLFC